MLIQQCKFLFVGPGQNFAARGPLFRFHHHQKVSDAGSVAPRHKRVASDQKGTAYKT